MVGYRKVIIRTFKPDVFAFIGNSHISAIKPLDFLEVLRFIEKCGTLEKLGRCDTVAPIFFIVRLSWAECE